MARKVFISVLGTGNYKECTYIYGESFRSTTPYIQCATLSLFGAGNWPSNSKAYILVTSKSKSKNWDPNDALNDRLKEMNLPFRHHDIIIPDGRNEDEIWNIFEQAYNLIDENDEVYFDLTHGFRYLPMLILVLGNYAKFLKKIKVCGITYGNWEDRNQITNEAPIVNLLPLSSLQDWTFATADFLENGYTERLAQLAKNSLAIIKRNYADKRADASSLGNYINSLDTIIAEILFCRGKDIIDGKNIEKAIVNYEKIEHVVIPQLSPVLRKSLSITEGFNRNNIANMYLAADWCFKHNLFQQSATFLEEGLISLISEPYGIELDDQKRRGLITKAISIIQQKTSLEEQIVNPEHRDLLDCILTNSFLNEKGIASSLNNFVDVRNDFNHCGMRKGSRPSKRLRESIEKELQSLKSIFIKSSNDSNLFNYPPLLLNLSNHPSSLWDEKQAVEARKYGNIEDMPFPAIHPEASASEIHAIAEEYADKILEKAEQAHLTVHIMGEMTFTFDLVSMLKAEGITCIASTTERIADMNDNTKISEFHFVRFREY